MPIPLFFAVLFAAAQTPSGTIEGTVSDPAGEVVPGAQVRAESSQMGLSRSQVSSERGDYVFAGLQAGEYLVEVRVAGFRSETRQVNVKAGSTLRLDFPMRVGEISQSITVDGGGLGERYEAFTLGGYITRQQIQNIPQNGRNFLDFAKLEPGVQSAARLSSNRIAVPVLGAPGGSNSGRGTRITVDGGSIMAVGIGGSAMGFSQESVQEFQVSTVNFDLSTGSTVSGAINAITRSGGNDFSGSAFLFFRDHNLAAYPALARSSTDPDPFFQRRQFGLALGGPIRRDRLFFFTNLERNEQRGVSSTTLTDPQFSHLSRTLASPFFGNQINMRVDSRLKSAHSIFMRYAHDGGRAFGPPPQRPNAYASNWLGQTGWTDQSLLGITSSFSQLVNDFRFSYFFNSVKQFPADERDCSSCLGIGAPSIAIPQVGLTLGAFDPSVIVGRRFHISNFVTWQFTSHRARFGVDWEHNRQGRWVWLNEPAALTLYSPVQAVQAGITPPASFDTLDDILALPLRSVSVGIGDPRVPQSDNGLVRHWDTVRLFFQDTWRVRPRLAVTYGLAWTVDRNLNYDLKKPSLLAPVFGETGLGTTRKEWGNVSPALGLEWTPFPVLESVVRAGAGIFYDFEFQPGLDAERAALGPPGLGRQTFPGSSIANPLTDIPGVPSGTPLDFRTAGPFSGADLLAALPAIQSSLLQQTGNGDPSVQQIQLSKTGTGLNGSRVPRASALHLNIGVEQPIAKDFVVSANLAYRRFNHVALGAIDANRFRSVNGPVIPLCGPTERSDPQALCSNGPINVFAPVGRATYTGLLVRLDKQFRNGVHLLGSWAFSDNQGTSPPEASGFNLFNWHEHHGPLPTDVRHILNIAGTLPLRSRFALGFNLAYSSVPPFSAYVGGMDFNGDGTTGDLLPGSTYNLFNRGMNSSDLELLVARFNQTYAGAADSQGTVIPSLTLPSSYALDDNFHSLDLRLTRSFQIGDRTQLTVVADVFNAYNSANLSGTSGDLTNAATFGRPTARSSQIFGSGGARAVQLGVKVGF